MSDSEYTTEQHDSHTVQTAVAALSQSQVERLGTLLDAVERAESYGAWAEVSENQIPWFTYSEEVQALTSYVYEINLVVSFDWMGWIRVVDQDNLPVDTVVNAVKTTTALVRGERFTDGLLRSRLESGVLQAALRKIISECA